MLGTVGIIRSDSIAHNKNLGPLFEWSEGDASLIVDKVIFNEKRGAILCYYNPPVHQIGTAGLFAFHEALDTILKKSSQLDFLLLTGSNGPVHSGGDLKESLARLKESLEEKRKIEATGGSKEEIDRLFNWGEGRLEKGIMLYKKIREAARSMRIVALCGGGLRFGGSAEIPLMADYIVGDSRSGMCFSEAMIGIIPGWGGITRVLVKAGLHNAACMAKTANPVFASGLKEIGVYDSVVQVPFELPKIQRAGSDAERLSYSNALQEHDKRTGAILLPEGLKWATFPHEEIQRTFGMERKRLAEPEKIAMEVDRRANPDNYAHLWGKSLKDVKHEIDRLGRPLAPQSINAIECLMNNYDPLVFDEEEFVYKELWADAALYRDPRFLEGLSASLDHRVPDFRSL